MSSPQSHSRALLFVNILSICLQASATCYLPNGTIADSNTLAGHPAWEFAACNNGTEFSMCCRTNLTSADAYRDTCRSDGLCTLQADDSVWRTACTDPTWQSDACAKLCTTGRDTDGDLWAATTAPITVCDDGSYCCGDNGYAPKANPNGPSCCSAGQGLWVVDGKTTSVNPNNSISSPSSSSSASTSSSTYLLVEPTSAKSSKNPQPSNSPQSNNAGAIAGCVVGGIAGLVFVVLAFWYFMIRRDRKQAPAFLHAPIPEGLKQSLDAGSWRAPVEAPTYEARARSIELDGGMTAEIDGVHRFEK